MSTPITEIFHQVGWTIAHTAWQFTAIALIAWLVLRTMQTASAQSRYFVQCVTLLAMIAAVPISFSLLDTPPRHVGIEEIPNSSPGLAVAVGSESVEFSGSQNVPSSIVAGTESSIAGSRSRPDVETPAFPTQGKTLAIVASSVMNRVRVFIQRHASQLTLIWIFGVTMLSLRPMIALRMVFRLRANGVSPIDEETKSIVSRLIKRMRLHRSIGIVQSTRVAVPTVVGWLKPLILLPPSAITGLSRQQLADVIAHELAHIRRQDPLVNTLQTIAETILFYHPAVWWISHRLRVERENCCDDVVVALSDNRRGYVEMLLRVEQLRMEAIAPRNAVVGLSANGGSLVERIRRITQPRVHETPTSGPVAVALLLFSAISFGVLFAGRQGTAAPPEVDTPPTGQSIRPDSIQSESVDAWFQPRPYPRLLHTLSMGPDAMFIQITADRRSRKDIGVSEAESLQHAAIYDVAVAEGAIARETGVERLSAKQRWEAGRKKVEKNLSETQIQRVNQLVVRQMGHTAFMLPELQEQIGLTDDQTEAIANAVLRYRTISRSYAVELDERMREIIVEHHRATFDSDVASLMLDKAKREHVDLRQLWSDLAEILTEKQRETYRSLRGPIPESLKTDLPKLQRFWEPYFTSGSLSVRGPQNPATSFPDLAPPSEEAFIKRWLERQRDKGLEIQGKNDLGKIHLIREKIADYVDPPRVYPLVGPARLHHSHYKGTLFIGDDKVDVVYMDSTHLHPITDDEARAESELTSSTVSISAHRGDPRKLANQPSLLRYKIANSSSQPQRDLIVTVSFGKSVEIIGATDQEDSHLQPPSKTENRVAWKIDSLPAGETTTLEIQVKYPSDPVAPITTVVASEKRVMAIHRFPPVRGEQP